jgi:hypothetical protein
MAKACCLNVIWSFDVYGEVMSRKGRLTVDDLSAGD